MVELVEGEVGKMLGWGIDEWWLEGPESPMAQAQLGMTRGGRRRDGEKEIGCRDGIRKREGRIWSSSVVA
jgi:hypothetical protein